MSTCLYMYCCLLRTLTAKNKTTTTTTTNTLIDIKPLTRVQNISISSSVSPDQHIPLLTDTNASLYCTFFLTFKINSNIYLLHVCLPTFIRQVYQSVVTSGILSLFL